MGLLGFGILVASISFLCYKHPPSSWTFLTWLQPSTLQTVAKRNLDAPTTNTLNEQQEELKEIPSIKQDDPPLPNKAEQDRKAMPPPPPPFMKSKPSSPPTPRAISKPQSPSIPSFNLSDGQEDEDTEPEVPSFPAANSAQRARGGTHPQIPLFPSANSAQRASAPRPPAVQNAPQQIRGGGGLMAPPPRGPIPNRGAPSASSSLAPPPTHDSIPTKPRKKVLLTPGHSPLDWARLTSSPTANLRGLPPSTPYLRVPPSLLKQYTGRKGKDAWTVLGGKVYNMTPYLPYHPGGEPELMKAAGRDGTKLFGEVHPWVNWEGMLEGCLIGIAVGEGEVGKGNKMDEMD
jgi:cytochrome b involved in lipid metabolism